MLDRQFGIDPRFHPAQDVARVETLRGSVLGGSLAALAGATDEGDGAIAPQLVLTLVEFVEWEMHRPSEVGPLPLVPITDVHEGEIAGAQPARDSLGS